MKRITLRISTIIFALMLTIGMSSAVFGAEETPYSEGESDTDHGVTVISGQSTTSDTLELPKDVAIFNDNGHVIDAPEITYSYSIEAANVSDGTSIKDFHGNSAKVRSGVAGKVTLSSSADDNGGATADLDFSGEKAKDATNGHDYSSSAKKYTKNLYVNIDISGISTPGIYRYKITDTTDAALLENAGIVRDGDYDADRYLDIYVANKDGGGMYLSGHVLFKSGSGDTSFEYNAGGTSAIKVKGFDASSEATADQYHTYNLEITKTVGGAMGDKTHVFPFSIDTANAKNEDTLSDIYYKVAAGAESSGKIGTAITGSIKDTETIYLYGLPQTTVFNITETNDLDDAYLVTIYDDQAEPVFYNGFGTRADDGSQGTAVGNGATAQASTDTNIALVTGYSASKVGAKAMGTMNFLNYLAQVSPTNVVMRFAPFLFIFAAAIVLLVLMRKRRSRDDEADAE